MSVGKISDDDFHKLLKPVHLAQHDSTVLGEEHARLSPELFAKIGWWVNKLAYMGDSKSKLFWDVVHGDRDFLPGLSRLLWHTHEWKNQKRNILALLAIQQGSRETAAQVMNSSGSGFFDAATKIERRALTIAHGEGWDRQTDGAAVLFFDAHIERRNGVEQISHELSVRIFRSQNPEVVSGGRIEIRPRHWVADVYNLDDINVRVRYGGEPLKRIESVFGWVDGVGNVEKFKARTFSASLSLAPLQSALLSIEARGVVRPAYGRSRASYLSQHHALFLHPLGLSLKT